MGPRRFVAPTAAEALKKIKAEIGAEAIVLSNREVPEGIEIVAIEPDALKALAHANPPAAPQARPPEPARVIAPPSGAIISPPVTQR
ncbi:MAG: flagellar biosynthesis protein FlhF, partial [Pseudomonadota bacterium]